MPHLGQLPGASRTISGCIGQVYFIVWPLAATGWAVLQPVRVERAATSNNAIIIQFILFIVLSFVVFIFRFAVNMTVNCFVHSFAFRNRNALAMTETELKLIAAPAITGLKSKPKNG